MGSNTGVAPETVIYINGISEIVFGILLGAGLFTCVAAAVLTVHIIGITISVGYNPVGIRDIAILIGSASIFFYGPDWLCIDWCRKKFRRRRQAEREYYREC